jgi:uncharacterized protein DUF4238
MTYQNQHFVTASYLKAWCDPQTPNGAWVWVVSKKERTIFKKSPKSLFTEDDFYTAYDPSGNRILALEHRLEEIEGKFISLRDNKLKNHQPLEPQDRMDLALFVSTMYARTQREKEAGKQIWRDYLEIVESLPPNVSSMIKRTRDYQDVIKVHKDQPMIFHLFLFVNMTAQWLFYMNCAIYETILRPGIITSDNPCIWYDPGARNALAPPTYYGVGSPTLIVVLPISPKQFVIFDQSGPDGYIDLHSKPENEEEFVDDINRSTTSNCEEQIVVSEKRVKESWFAEGQ